MTEAIDPETYGIWLGGGKLEGFKFRHNDCVVIISGEHKDKRGSVVGLQRLEKGSPYIVETVDHGDVEAKEDELDSINL